MQSNNAHGGRWLAVAAGTLFTSGALAVLLEDIVMQGAPFSLKHALVIITVAGTMMVGHLCSDAIKARHILAAGGFALLFVAGTILTVYSSVGKQAGNQMATAAEAEAAAEARTAAKRGLERAEAMLTEAQGSLARECKTGKGKRCEGIQATIAVYDAAARGHKAELAKIGPAKPVAPEAEKVAEVAAVFGADKERVKAGIVLTAPFFLTIFLELGAIISFSFAFRGDRKVADLTQWEPSEADRNQTSFARPADLDALRQLTTVSLPKPGNSGNSGNPGNGGGRKVYCREEAEADLVTRLAFGETVSSQDDLAARWGVNKSTVSKWLKAWEREQLIPARQQIGRTKQLAAA